jgi:hypothetical protein
VLVVVPVQRDRNSLQVLLALVPHRASATALLNRWQKQRNKDHDDRGNHNPFFPAQKEAVLYVGHGPCTL